VKSLILPVAGESSRYPNMRPKWLLTMPDGMLMIEKSVSKLNIEIFDHIYVVALKSHIKKYSNILNLTKSLKKNISNKVKLIQLTSSTTCQAETVQKAILKEKINGAIVIKDCDNMFRYNFNKKKINEVMVMNLKNTELIEAKSKSYIDFDKLNSVTNIVEKKVISDFFCCGAYSFKSAKEFLKYSSKLLKISDDVFISHVIFEMILNNNHFTFKEANEYIDWGTVREFRNWQRKHFTIFCDFDGCLVNNGSKFGKMGFKTSAIKENLGAISEILRNQTVELIIVTSRPDTEKKFIINTLKKFNIRPKHIITNLLHAKRYLINDYSVTNPYPSSISINIERDSKKLGSILTNLSS
jgi:hypothetical protein